MCQQQRATGPAGIDPVAGDLDPNDARLSNGRSRRSTGTVKVRRPMSEEHREKIAVALAGRKRRPLDEDHKRCGKPCLDVAVLPECSK